jgi:hypothetical protein
MNELEETTGLTLLSSGSCGLQQSMCKIIGLVYELDGLTSKLLY